MWRGIIFSAVVFGSLLITPHAAQAYIGPGAGITVVGAVLGLLSAVGLAAAGLVWYPIKRLRARRRARTTTVLARSEDPA